LETRSNQWLDHRLEVVDGLNNSTRASNSIDEVTAAVEDGNTRVFFDERTRWFGIKCDEEPDDQEENDRLDKALSIVSEIFVCA
jgi:hypothetical protein